MTLATDEFIRRFLIHVLPSGFHRIRHYGLFASGARADNIARARATARRAGGTAESRTDADSIGDSEPQTLSRPCPAAAAA